MDAAANSCSPPEAADPKSAGYGPLPEAETRECVAARGREGRKVLILDDDAEVLEILKKIVGRLPSRPQVRLAESATRALELLDSEPFELLITDLRMPKIDGFQVLLSARRRLPDLKTVVLTGVADQQYRTRAYEAGIDLFMEKPTTQAEIRIFGECVEALLVKGDKEDKGFRGIQSKSLMDLVQIECLSQKSSVLKITSGVLEGRVWIVNGNIIDAEADGRRGEEAFRYLFEWKTGNFELMPGDHERERTIFTSCESLLLDSAQTLDEATAGRDEEKLARDREFTALATVRGVKSLLLIGKDGECDLWGVEKPEAFAGWTRRVLRDFQGIGDMLKAGRLSAVQAAGRERGFVWLSDGKRQLMAGMDRKMTVKFLRKAGQELAMHLKKDLEKGEDDEAKSPAKSSGALAELPPYVCGGYTVSNMGKVMESALPSDFPRVIMELLAKVVLSALSSARELESPLTEIAADFSALEIRAREAEGGAIIFITPQIPMPRGAGLDAA